MSKPIYLETWRVFADGSVTVARPDGLLEWIDGDDEGRAELAAAAPTMVRALLRHEIDRDGMYTCCFGRETPDDHAYDCDVDAALTAAGFPDAASRDEARRKIAEERR
jgi:hypothetical protein